MAAFAVIFPGQGAQSVGMGRDAAEQSPAARTIFDRAAQILKYDIARLCWEGPASELEKTDLQQPAIYVTSVALWEALCETGIRREDFACAGGLSLGEYTALHVGGALGFEDGLRLVQRRGRLMQDAAEATRSGMVSLVGADAAMAERVCDRARGDDVLVPANFNCPGQIVISGSMSACERAVGAAEQEGCRAVPLAVAGAFHSPLMEPAARGLAVMLEQTQFKAPHLQVISNVDAGYHSAPGSIRSALARQLVQPVLWQRCMERMIADGVTGFVEVGPGRVLAGLLRKIDRGMPVVNVHSMEGIPRAVETVQAR